MVSEAVGKLLEGIDNKSGKKAVKYSIAFDGMLPCHSDVFTAAGYASEDMALPEAIMGHVKKDDGHRNIYVMDRGLQSTRVMKAFNDQKVALAFGKPLLSPIRFRVRMIRFEESEVSTSIPRASREQSSIILNPGRRAVRNLRLPIRLSLRAASA